MSGFQCPYCSMFMSKGIGTESPRFPSFDKDRGTSINGTDESCIKLTFYKCPNCAKYTLLAKGIGERVKEVNTLISPISLAKHFPDYIPLTIREDYQEAYDIVNLSPKASATLSRRCLQGMIRDFWGIKKNTLCQEIQELESIIPATQKQVLNSLRRLGNIGAHPEIDVNTIIDINPEDAIKLLKVIEVFIQQWYIERHEQEKLYSEIMAIDADAQHQRNE